MDFLLQAAAKATERFNKDELYSFLAGAVVGLFYFLFFPARLESAFPTFDSGINYYLVLVVVWLLSTLVTYVISQIIVSIHILIFWIWAKYFADWNKKLKNYLEQESNVRLLNEFSNYINNAHIFSLISAILVVLYLPLQSLSLRLGLTYCYPLTLIVSLFSVSQILIFLLVYRWLKLEQLYLLEAFSIVDDITLYLKTRNSKKTTGNKT